jgi:hypothetical protein
LKEKVYRRNHNKLFSSLTIAASSSGSVSFYKLIALDERLHFERSAAADAFMQFLQSEN